MTYDANSIRILTEHEIQGFDWKRAELLADERGKPVKWILRGFEVSHRLNMSTEYFENKYIFGEEVETIPEFTEVFSEVLKEDRLNAIK